MTLAVERRRSAAVDAVRRPAVRQIADRIGALVGYVRQEFPGRDVWDRIDTDHVPCLLTGQP